MKKCNRCFLLPLAILLVATLAGLIMRTPHGPVEAIILYAVAWIWAFHFSEWLRHRDRLLDETVIQLTETVDRWASGDLQARVYLDQADPLDSLAHGMNRVAEVLAERTEDLQQDKERLEAILSSMANGIIILGHGLTITLINQAAYELFGLGDEPVTGKHLLEVIRDMALDDAVTKVTREGGTDTVLWSPPDNDNFVVEVTVGALNQPIGGLGAVLVARNVSAQKQVERMRQDFVANVSHELQTPLTVIRGFTETLLDNPDDPSARRFLELIHEEATRMSRLVDDLLTLSRMEHHSMPMRRQGVDVPVLIESVTVKLSPRIQSAGLTLENHIPAHMPLVAGDPDLLAEVFMNLVSNAVQYTPAGGRISLDMALDVPNHMVGISVKDTGIGIPAQDVPRIFERFYRVDRARSRASGGTGLGLAIVKHIMELHHGRIEVKSTVGVGTEFLLWLPEFESERDD
ncbi:PAS domain-containing sensor histidine kinase [Sulfobacillus thermosulfidooxidans]|uniref:histidine kinase n=2 Tax=Sulfobacillus thermosulfidooxidans TaxID=28034 RepID=A0A1R0IKS2_SULTH|nr:PAS domain-containing sensor histidine kinase [Sulfobacillus thermosulfidooxidans]OLZ14362.1 PAS domain-containing sensor histidine kinase [Sulfobacillus thermosulfidooxidans]OLZ19105.1 PAS domain-containing sensor histidine kinase [Sulfobacillus thermosulfidooxidans]PSR28515.1 MAG: PAS domain-containing sensor histidine kinase [Sulfobacillus thermosulfidooxidans]